MIAVIADDLTGAAELGGIGLRRGLTTEICMEVPASTGAKLLVIATDTRSMMCEDAVAEMEKVTGQLMQLKPEWIYKKTDSVLRGHVAAEIGGQLRVLGLKRCLLAPANPALGRTIHEGKYFFNGQPVSLSSFSTDPEFPVTSSDVRDMLGSRAVQVVSQGAVLPDKGIMVGEVGTDKDLYDWAGYVDAETFPAGAAGFFAALLQRRGIAGEVEMHADDLAKPMLFVSGTTFEKSREAMKGIEDAGGPVKYLPVEAREVVGLLIKEGRAIVAISPLVPGDAHLLKEQMAKLIADVLAATRIGELVIEGGATAYAILRAAGLKTFVPVEELAPGVVRMRTQTLHITVKPGSYQWPEKTNILPI